MPWQVGIRNGDTPMAERQKQKASLPEILIITPESLHLLLSTKDHGLLFENLEVIAVDEWHELMGGKRGIQSELCLSWLRGLRDYVDTGQRGADARTERLSTAPGHDQLLLVTCWPFDATAPRGPLRYVVTLVPSPGR